MTAIEYALDADNKILSVSGNWDTQARRVEAYQCLAKNVVGRNVLDLFCGADVRSFYNALFFAARRFGKEVSLPTACVDRDMLNEQILMVQPRGNATLDVICLTTQYQYPKIINVSGLPFDKISDRCSVCCKSLAHCGGAGRMYQSFHQGKDTVCSHCKRMANSHLFPLRSVARPQTLHSN